MHPSSSVYTRLLSVFCLFAFPTALQAEDKVLFLGNSFTYGDGGTSSVATIFDRLAIAGGHEDPTVEMRAVGGQNFQFHENDATSRSMIASMPWTHVVIQNYSTEPTHVGSVANHQSQGTLLYNRILANNAATKVVLYETWARAAVHSMISGTSTATTFASTTEMQGELRTNYRGLLNSLNASYPANPPVTVAPVGSAWENAGGLLPQSHQDFRRLHTTDNYHGNNNGYFLAAATIYATIYGQSPEGLHLHPAFTSLNLAMTVDPTFLEQTAWETVSGNAGIRYSTHPSPATVAQNQPVTFSAEVRGSLPVTVQWFRNGLPIPGATGLSYTIPHATADLNGSEYTVQVTNSSSSPFSNAALLTVVADSEPPVAAEPVIVNATTVRITFSEALAAGPAATSGNFSVVYQGRLVPVTSSSLSQDGKSVELALATPVTKGFAVVVSGGVTDLSGNSLPSGMVVISPAPAATTPPLYFDFGAAGTTTGAAQDATRTWNNITPAIGASNIGVLDPLKDSTGANTGARLQMVRRFNDANSNGTTTSTAFPASATQDSLYGNTENWVGLSNIFPAFRLAGLNPQASYSFVFFASRTGASDNRQTIYTVTGAGVSTASLDAANNVNNVATLVAVNPSAAGEILIELSAGPQNNSPYHFTYLGAMVMTPAATQAPVFHPAVVAGGHLVLDWSGSGALQASPDLANPWSAVLPQPSPPYSEPLNGSKRFFRLASPAQ